MPSNKMDRFEVFIGTWNTTGEVLETESAPAAVMSATDTYEWLPGRHFVIHRVDARFGKDAARSLEVFGYDKARRKFTSRSYDDRGVSDDFGVELERGRFRISGKSVRFDGKFDARRSRLTGLWELKGKTAGWQPWIKLELVRA